MKKFRISFDVPEAKLATIISLLSGECINLSVSEAPRIPFTETRNHGARGKSPRAGRLTPLILATMQPNIEYTHDDPRLVKPLVLEGFATTSLGPTLSDMLRENKIKRIKKGVYQKI